MSSAHLPVMQNSYAKRLTALGLAVTLGFFGIFGFILWESRQRDLADARLMATNLVASLSSEMERAIELYDLSLQAVVDETSRAGAMETAEDLKRLTFFDRLSTGKYMGSIFIVDRTGSTVADTRDAAPTSRNYASADFFRVALGGVAGTYIGTPWTASDGERVINISRRLSAPDGAFAGVVVGTLRLSYFREMFRKVTLSQGDALTLVRQNGSIITRAPYDAGIVGRDLGRLAIFKRMSAEGNGSFEEKAVVDGVDRMYVFQRVANAPLIMSYGLSLDTVFAGWRQEFARLGLMMLVLCTINAALIVFLARTLKSRSLAQYQLSLLATTDSLTGLYNRRHLDEMMEREWRRAMRSNLPIAVLMIDVDHFKAYNDTHGHQAGDKALAAIASCIKEFCCRSHDIAARYGGEEFALVLPETSQAQASKIAEMIRQNVANLSNRGYLKMPTVSIGIASAVPGAGYQPTELIEAADAALYGAKDSGRNLVRCAELRVCAAETQARPLRSAI